MTGASGLYPKRTESKATSLARPLASTVAGASSISGRSRKAKMRSAAAARDCSTLDTWASWVMGWVKFFTYWMKA